MTGKDPPRGRRDSTAAFTLQAADPGPKASKSQKWTCKACGEKQSFLRAYGEGSGADCRNHVQKLNLLQGQLSEMSPRILKGGLQDENKEKIAQPTEKAHLQPSASESRWQKYLEKGPEEKMVVGDKYEEPEATFCQKFSLKRKRGPNAVLPSLLSPTELALGPLANHWKPPAPRSPCGNLLAVDSQFLRPVTAHTSSKSAKTPACSPPKRLADLFQTGEDFDDDPF